jgi:hypothetical protein
MEDIPYFKQFSSVSMVRPLSVTSLSPAPSPPRGVTSPQPQLTSQDIHQTTSGAVNRFTSTISHTSVPATHHTSHHASASHPYLGPHSHPVSETHQASQSSAPASARSTVSTVPSFHDESELQLTPSQQLVLQQLENDMQQKIFAAKQLTKKLPEFGNFAETCLENTLMNIIQESFKQEFNVTSRPRFQALPLEPTSTPPSTDRHTDQH